ncbi:MAG: DUF1080 domain-containing protein, partial [Planctomycetes bacterium]|nr:DUF1080 domain-containing protein [Planctomycetota bacterium]
IKRPRLGAVLSNAAVVCLFGGRSLVLWTADPPEPPFEFGVQVRLAQEDGAAGLVFHSDGGDRHYGFYPSSGNLRLSRFDGPDVFSWNVLEQVTSEHYRPGEWNAIKVRVEKDRIRCFVNDELAIESTDTRYTSGKVGLAKFRHTEAEFRNFRIAENLPPSRPPAETVKRIRELAAELSLDAAASGELVEKLLPHGDVSGNVLREQARELEQRAERLRELAADIHTRRIHGELQKALKGGDETIDLVRAALLVAALDNEELDVDAYLQTADRMAAAIRETLPPDADAATTLAALDAHLFEQFGYHGSRTNYYDRSNSYLNEVIDDREGLPIMLSILYMELARRLDLNVVGVGLPGHFIVRFEPAEGESQLIDPFDRGARLSREDAAALVAQNTGAKLEEEHLRPQSKREMVLRVLQNLLSVARREQDERGQLRYVDLLVALEPAAAELRAYRADLLMRTRRYAEAIDEVDWFLREKPEGADLARLRELRAALERSLAGEGDE